MPEVEDWMRIVEERRRIVFSLFLKNKYNLLWKNLIHSNNILEIHMP